MATITQRGPAAWRAQIRRKGVKRWMTFSTEGDARAWAEQEEAQIDRPAAAPPPVAPITGLSVADLFQKYGREVSPTKGGERWEVIRLKKLAAYFPILAAATTPGDIARFRDLRLTEVSASTVRRELELVSGVFTRAIREWALPLAANPVHLIARPKKPEGRSRRVSDEERAAILRQLGWDGLSAPTNRKQWVAWGFLVALETMMRQSEIFRLTWEHVHLGKRYSHLPKTKGGYRRDVPLSSRARALFEMLPPGEPGQRVLRMNQGTFGAYFGRAVKAAGIKDLHYHDSRREALTRTAEKLPNVAELARASGHHGDLRSLMIYYHPTATDTADKLG